MNPRDLRTREEFGSYILLKKLFEDPMGETFRAGKTGRDGLEEVLLLRVFNGPGVDAERLWSRLLDRRPVQEALKSPNLGHGIDLGRVRNVPYVAYEYISGKPLSNLMAKAEHDRSPIPTDLALLIAERIALGLTVGYETRVNDQRLHHGFLAPHLVMLGNEGDIRVLGYEAAPGLREQARSGALASEFARYLSPEALAGQAVHKADDVYSLGAVLFELLTGRRATTGAGANQVTGTVLAAEGSPLPEEVAQLLRRSLSPQAERIPDVMAWHKALSKLMADGQYRPTTFNLAFFMHNLFRDEIEAESKEIEKEKTLVGPARDLIAPAAPPPAAATAPPSPAAAPAFQGFEATDHGTTKPGPNKALLGAIAALVLVGAGAGIYFGFLRGDKATPAATPPTDETITVPESLDPAATPPAESAPAQQPAGISQEELRAQLEQLVAERYAVAEKNLRAQYDDKIKSLQTSLEQAQRQPERPAQPATVPVTPAAGAGTPPAGAAAGGEAATPSAANPPSGPAATPAQPSQEPAASPPPAPVRNEPAPPPTAAPARQQVRVGDLVDTGTPGLVQAKLRSMTDPRYPPAARQLNKSTGVVAVRVRVLVDENGRVARAELSGSDPGYGFVDAAIAAARSARFDPATVNGVRVKMWTVMRVDFKP